MASKPITDNGKASTQYLTIKDCERKSCECKTYPPACRDVALLKTVPLKHFNPSIQPLMSYSKQLKLFFEKKLSASVTYVGPIHPTTDKDLSSVIQPCTEFEAIAVIMFGHKDNKQSELKQRLNKISHNFILSNNQTNLSSNYYDLFPCNFNENFPNLKDELFCLIKEITNFLDIPVAVTNGSVFGSQLSLKCDPFQWSLFKDFFRDRARFITGPKFKEEDSELIDSLFTAPAKLPKQPTVPRELPLSSYDPLARPFEVGSPKDWSDWNDPSGSRFSELHPGATPVPNSQLSGRGGSPCVPSTTTGPASSTASSGPSFGGASGKQNCPICMDDDIPAAKWCRFNCGHGVCSDCQPGLDANDYKCPICKAPFKKALGTQPKGTMNVREEPSLRIPGFENDLNCRGAIVIYYNFPSGKQGPEHPHPGSYYTGTSRTCYLPNNPQGQKVLSLLRRAFEARLVFTIGKSVTTGADDSVIWNNIHHKTSVFGGSTAFGYPDDTYLARVTDELKGFGII